MSSALKLATTSLFVGALVLGLKMLAWWLTGSVALLSDALESIVNLATALAALIAIRVAARPADDTHPFGHHKAEFFSATLEGLLIVLAALLILREAFYGFLAPHALTTPLKGLLVNGGATVLNGVWAWVLIRQGRRLKSPALVADGQHLWTDVLTSFGVAIGLILTVLTGWWALDPLMASLVALHILWTGGKIVLSSLSSLMDEAVPDETLALIRTVIAAESQGAVEAHDLKTRHAGRATFVEFHLVVPGEMNVFDAHEICDRLEAALHKAVPGAQVTIHLEPDHKSEETGIILPD
ncbi:cation diffusion facilitator family transporter [Shimia sp. FJ5]|uniref:cation diffusion facilitator family transporter n=1 Tax=Shimia sp. FJ5 TaxID=3079054 RepID=UPI002610DE8C|nr:cation diffusion facilitator family transporter [Shimia sp. FJ5]MDV4143932.1 cation diffusion facilitator family transporter [Shimia sp. FJ5]